MLHLQPEKHSSGVILALYVQHSEWSQRDRLSKLSSFSLILINHREGFGVWPEKPTKVLNYRFDNALNVQFECGKKTWKKCPEYSVLNLRVPVRTSDLEIIFGFDPSNNSGPDCLLFQSFISYENFKSIRKQLFSPSTVVGPANYFVLAKLPVGEFEITHTH